MTLLKLLQIIIQIHQSVQAYSLLPQMAKVWSISYLAISPVKAHARKGHTQYAIILE